MKLKLAIATCVAALALPMAPATAAEAESHPGTCYESTYSGLGRSLSWWSCECVVGAPWITHYYFNHDPLQVHVTIQYCHIGNRIPH